MIRRLKVPFAGLILVLLPLLAHAEVSVQLDRQGKVKRVNILTSGARRGGGVWSQVRPRVPLEYMLNPLGDTYGDLAPTVAMHPLTGNPWAVWPRNEGNQKRLMVSAWDGHRWTVPQTVAQPDPMGYDQLTPYLVFDAEGRPYLVYGEKSPKARVLFTTLLEGRWSPPLLLSDPVIDSSFPNAAIQEGDYKLVYRTPTGSSSLSIETSRLVDGAISLMDSPIPPGAQPGPGGPDFPGGGGSGNGGSEDRDPFLQVE
jgi:hypothetical protein